MAVVCIEKVLNRNSPAVLPLDSYEEGYQVKKRTLANSSAALAEHPLKITQCIIDNLKLALQGVSVPTIHSKQMYDRRLSFKSTHSGIN